MVMLRILGRSGRGSAARSSVRSTIARPLPGAGEDPLPHAVYRDSYTFSRNRFLTPNNAFVFRRVRNIDVSSNTVIFGTPIPGCDTRAGGPPDGTPTPSVSLPGNSFKRVRKQRVRGGQAEHGHHLDGQHRRLSGPPSGRVGCGSWTSWKSRTSCGAASWTSPSLPRPSVPAMIRRSIRSFPATSWSRSARGTAFVNSFANVSAFETAKGLVCVDSGAPFSAPDIHRMIRAWSPAARHHDLFPRPHRPRPRARCVRAGGEGQGLGAAPGGGP